MDIVKRCLCGLGLALMLSSPVFGEVNIDATNFPDTKFRNYVSNQFDENTDGILSDAEISRAREIDIQGQGTMDLTGIEHLTGLRSLACKYPMTTTSGGSFNYGQFKTAYSLKCEIDDSYWLMMNILIAGREGLMTPMIRDIIDTSTGDEVLKFPTTSNQTVKSISFRTRGIPSMEVYVLP